MASRSRTTLRQAASDPRNRRGAISAVESLRADEKMAALMPTVLRMAAIQKDCETLLPGMFEHCAVIRLDDDRLILSAPNAAMLARLKQNLPQLQQGLNATGWQVSAIQLKVQPKKNTVESKRSEKMSLPKPAIEAFAALENAIEKTPHNEALRQAVAALVRRHR